MINGLLMSSKLILVATFFGGSVTAFLFYLFLIFVYHNTTKSFSPNGLFTSPLTVDEVILFLSPFKCEDGFRWKCNVGSQIAKKSGGEVENRSLETEALASLHVALEMKSTGRLDKARKLFNHALALHPSHPDILNHYGEFLEQLENDVIQADHLYSKALVFCPGHSRALSNRERTSPQVEELDHDRLMRVDAKRDLLSKIPEASSALRRVKHEAYFQHIHHTVALEGNTMTLAQTRHIVETRMAVAGKSILEHNEILGLDAALSYVNSTLVHRIGAIKVQDILEIHKRVLGFADPIEAGQFRRTQVWVSNHIPPSPSDVVVMLDEFVSWMNGDESLQLHPIEFAALAHFKLVFIHPFTDGNGRTARLLMNLILMQAGYPAVIVPKGERQMYYEHLQTADDGDVRPFVRFIAECTEKTLDVYLYATKEYPEEVPELESLRANERRRTIIVEE